MTVTTAETAAPDTHVKGKSDGRSSGTASAASASR